MTLLRWSLSVTILTLVLAACSSAAPTAAPEPTPSATPAPAPSATAVPPTDAPATATPSALADVGSGDAAFGSLVYVGSDGHVYVTHADGSGKVRISEADAGGARTAHTWPMWSGDGASVLFSRVVVADEGPRFSLESVTLGDGGPNLIYENPGAAQFVGRNAPHYTNASPDGRAVAFLAVSGSMALLIGDVAGGAPVRPIIQGSPLYYAWTHDSARLLLHLRDSLLLFEPDAGDTLTILDLPPSQSYRAPDWSPDGQRFVFIGDSADGASLLVASADGSNRRTLAPVSNTSAFAWSPAGNLIVFASEVAPNIAVFDGLLLVDPEDGRSRVLTEDAAIAFFWSPAGDRLAVISLAEQGGRLAVTVFDIETGAARRVVEFIPSSDMRVMLSYFDQYAKSHRVWSADGRYLALTGSLTGEEATPESHVLVIDTLGQEPPRVLAAGVLAFWSPVAVPSDDGQVRLSIHP